VCIIERNRRITKSLKTKNSHGYYEISTKILKLGIHYISSPLTYICNRMLSSSIFPTWLNFAEVKPVFKKRDKSVTSNYRPISLLTSFSKIFKKVIYDWIFYHINYNHVLVNKQFGFRHASSTDTLLLHRAFWRFSEYCTPTNALIVYHILV
jgi:Notch-like protein